MTIPTETSSQKIEDSGGDTFQGNTAKMVRKTLCMRNTTA